MKMIKVPRPPSPRRTPRRMLRPLQARTAAAREEDFEEYDAQAEPSMKLSHAFIVVLVLHVLAVGGVFAFNTLKTTQAAPGKKSAPIAEKNVEKSTEPVAKAPVQAAPAAAPAAAAMKPAAKPADAAADAHTVAAGDTITRIATQHKTTVEAIEKANGLEPTATIRVGQVLKIPAKAAAAKPAEAPVMAKAAPANEAAVTAKPAASPAAVAAKAAASPTAKTAASPAAKPDAAQPPAEAPAKPAAAGSTYTVAKGDNPYSIAKKLKVSYNDLIKANKIDDPTKLQIGQQLVVP